MNIPEYIEYNVKKIEDRLYCIDSGVARQDVRTAIANLRHIAAEVVIMAEDFKRRLGRV